MVNLRLDTKIPAKPIQANGTLLPGIFKAYEDGRVQVEAPPGSGNIVWVPGEPGVYAEDAPVRIRLGEGGKPVGIIPPDTVNTGSTPVGIGYAGELLLNTRAQATLAWNKTKEALAQLKIINDAATEAKQVANGLEQRFTAQSNRLDTVEQQIENELSADRETTLDNLKPGTPNDAVVTAIWDKIRAKMIVTRNLITRDMIATGSIEARHINASDTLSAKIAQFLKIHASQLILGKHVRWTDDSLTFYQIPPGNPSDEQLQQWNQRTPAIRLSPDGSSYVSLADAKGGVASSMNADGLITARKLTVSGSIEANSLNIAGQPIDNYLLNNQITLAGYVSLPPLRHPRNTQNITLAETEMILPAGLYMLSWPAEMTNDQGLAADAGGLIVLMQKKVGSSWQSLNFEHGRSQVEGWQIGGRYWNVQAQGYFRLSEETAVKFKLNVHSYLKQAVDVNPSVFLVWALPEFKECKYTLISHSSPTPTPPPAKTTHTKTYTSTAFRTFTTSGVPADTTVSTWFSGKACVGANPYYVPSPGIPKCMFLMPDWTADLRGATVKSIQVGYTVRASYYNAGATIVLGYHGATSLGSFSKFGGSFAGRTVKPGETVWVDVPIGNATYFKDGRIRGFVFTADNGNYNYNAQIASVTARITYEK